MSAFFGGYIYKLFIKWKTKPLKNWRHKITDYYVERIKTTSLESRIIEITQRNGKKGKGNLMITEPNG